MDNVKYYEINEDAARRAKELNSFSEYKAGSAAAEYKTMVDRPPWTGQTGRQPVSSAS